MGASANDALSEAEANRVKGLAEELGAAIAKADCILDHRRDHGPAGFGRPRSFRKHGGFALGISPAENRREHVARYGLPEDGADVIVFTGFGYKGTQRHQRAFRRHRADRRRRHRHAQRIHHRLRRRQDHRRARRQRRCRRSHSRDHQSSATSRRREQFSSTASPRSLVESCVEALQRVSLSRVILDQPVRRRPLCSSAARDKSRQISLAGSRFDRSDWLLPRPSPRSSPARRCGRSSSTARRARRTRS